MEITNEQLHKLFELADKTAETDINNIESSDISKALVEIERKLNFFDVDVNFQTDNKNILIVDDLELSLYQLNRLMKKIGIRTFVARNKDEAIAEIIRRSFNYLLIDLFLPDSDDGFALIEEAVKMRESGKQNYKIIVISGSDDKIMIDKSYKLGVDGYVTKSETWHKDILKYMNTESQQTENTLFKKTDINSEMVSYSLKKFNDKKIFDTLITDITSSVLAGQPNIVLNLEKVNVFDQDNTYIFADIYKLCTNAKGFFLLVNPSDKIKDALASAYLEGVIPVFTSLENAIDYVSKNKEQ